MADVASLDDIPGNFSPSYLPYSPTLRQKQRAIAFVKDCYVKDAYIYLSSKDTIQIKSQVFRSQRKSEEPHKVNIDLLKTNNTISDAHCSCKAGFHNSTLTGNRYLYPWVSGQCAHILAVILTIEQWKIAGLMEIPSHPSSTSLPQQWDKPRGPKICSEPVSQMIICRPTNLNRKRKPVVASFVDTRMSDITDRDMQKLKSLKSSPISYCVDKTCPSVETVFGKFPIGSPLAYHAPLIQPITTPRSTTHNCGDTVFPRALPTCINLDS
ncbi:uncharacterized protein LOC111117245 [Crassostrea virginica]